MAAIDELLLFGQEKSLRVGDIVRRADVGRSTFYEHFANSEQALEASIRQPLAILAKSSLRDDEGDLIGLLDHFRDHRARGIGLLKNENFRTRMIEVLAQEYSLQLPKLLCEKGLRDLVARQLADANLSLIVNWLELSTLNSDTCAAILKSTSRHFVEHIRNQASIG
ncbi:MAG: hypothetical protein KDB03_14280 [Planctomycetales bacterium]|nr:hypothetical protein [Planctomycetales bacterium]